MNKENFQKLDKKITMIPLTSDRMFKSVFSSNTDILKVNRNDKPLIDLWKV